MSSLRGHAGKVAVVTVAVALAAIMVLPSSAILGSHAGTPAVPTRAGPVPAGFNMTVTPVHASTPTPSRPSGRASNTVTSGGLPSDSFGSLRFGLRGLNGLESLRSDRTEVSGIGPLAGPSYGVASTLDLLNGTSLPGNIWPSNCLFPIDALYDTANGKVWVTCDVSGNSTGGASGEVLYLNGSDGRVVGAAATGAGATAEALVDAAAGPVVVVADSDASNITLIDAVTGEVVGSVTVGGDPDALAVNNTSGVVYVADYGSGDVWRINVTTLASTTVSVGTEPVSLAYDPANDKLFVSDEGSSEVTVLNGATLAVEKEVLVGGSPEVLAFDAPADTVLVANPATSNVTIVNATTDAVTSNLPVPQPTALAVDPTTGEAFVASGEGESVLPVLASGHAGTPVPLGNSTTFAYPYGLTVDTATGDLYVDTATEPLADVRSVGVFSYSEAVVNLTLGTLSARIGVAGGIFDVFVGTPLVAAIDPSSSLLFVPGSDSGAVSLLEEKSLKVGYTTRVGVVAVAVVGDPENGDVYALDAAPDQLEVANGTTGKLLATVPVPGLVNTFLAFDPWQSSILVAGGVGGGVSVIGAANHTFFSTIPGVGQPTASLADPLNGQIYLLSGGRLYAVNGLTDRPITSWTTEASGSGALALGPGDGTVYVANGTSVAVLDARTDVMAAPIPLGQPTASVVFDPANGDLYVTEPDDANVAVIDSATGALVTNVTVGSEPKALAFDRLNGDLYAADTGSDAVSVINGSTNAVVATVGTPASPAGFVVDSGTGNVYVGEANISALSVISGTTSALLVTVPVGLGLAGATLDPADTAPVTVNELSGTLSFLNATAPVYRVTFTDTGLSAGTPWRVSLGTASNTSTSATVTFLTTNGTYAFAVAASDYTATPTSGTLTVKGAAVVEPVTFVALPLYRVAFSETGLVSGTSWSVTLDGSENSSTSSELTFEVPSGTYQFASVEAVGYTVSPANGTVVVNGTSPAPIPVTFGELFRVAFTETGLPTGVPWQVELRNNTTLFFQSNSTTFLTELTFEVANGTYAFQTSAAGHFATPPTGTVVVAGKDRTVPLTFRAGFAVGFEETGLPANDGWSVSVAGTTYSPSGAWVNVTLANGSYPYTVHVPDDFRATPSSATVTVLGAPVVVPVAVTLEPGYYLATFAGHGLPAGSPWVVNLRNGTGVYTSGVSNGSASVAVAVADGPYSFLLAVGVAGWAAVPSSGSLTVSGANVTVPVAFVPGYNVTFVESGLLSGTVWSVFLNGTAMGGPSPDLNYSEPDGLYHFSVNAPSGYLPLPSTGTVLVNNSSVVEPIEFTPVASGTYVVAFEESGLESGDLWSVTLHGATDNSTGTSLNFTEPNGTFAYSIAGPAGYAAAPASGSVTVAGASLAVPVVFAQVRGEYQVTLAETGLPLGVNWSVMVPTRGTENGTSPGPVVFVLGNGSYTFTATALNHTYRASGAFVVAGSDLNVSVTFEAVEYTVTFTETGLPSGTTWFVNLTGGASFNGSGTSIAFPATNGSYLYVLATTDTRYSAPGGAFTVDGAPISEPATFSEVTSTVTFSESGLPSGTEWYVNISGGPSLAGTTAGLSTPLPNGSYRYTVATVDKLYSAPPRSLTVSGSPLGVPVRFAVVTFAVTFTESGLPTGTEWFVNVSAGPALSSRTSTIAVSLPNGSYTYTVATVDKEYHAPGAPLVVAGAPLSPAVPFSLVTYAVTFTEHGLPSGSEWYVNVTGQSSRNATGTTLVLDLPNGSYSYTAATALAGDGAAGGSFSVGGLSVPVPVAFGKVFAVTFTETGLPPGTEWFVNVTGQPSQNSTGTTIVVSELNGSYLYVAMSADRSFSAPGGGFSVAGGAVPVAVAFSELFVNPSAAVNPVDVNETTEISAGATGGSGSYASYAWSGLPSACATPGNVASFSCTPGARGTYTVELTVTDSHGGRVTGSLDLTVDPAVAAAPLATENPIDVGQNTTISAGASGGSGSYLTYAWSGLPTGCSDPGNVASFTCQPTGPGAFTVGVTVTDTNGGEVTGELDLAVDPALGAGTVSATGNPLDVGQSTVISTSGATGGSGEYTLYAWSGLPGGCASTEASFTCAPSAEGVFSVTLTVTDSNGANASASFSLSVDPPLHASPSATKNPVRAGQPTTIAAGPTGGSGSYSSYVWSGTVPSGCVLPSSATAGSFGCTPATGSQGSYSVTVAVTDSNGNTVSGSFSLTVAPAPVYPVTFTESGLLSGTEWYVNVTGEPSLSSTTTTVGSSLLNGSYVYVVATVDKEYSASGGSFKVSGGAVSEPVTFSLVTYELTFVESGLPIGTLWAVNLTGGPSQHSVVGILSFVVPNGTYAYTIVPPSSRWISSPSAGTATIDGSGHEVPVSFVYTYEVLVNRPANAPTGASWSVTVSGTNLVTTSSAPLATARYTSTGPTITFYQPNGTYDYWVLVTGKGSYNSSGSFLVDGSGVTLTPASVGTSSSALGGYLLYGLIAAVIVVVVVAALLLVRRRRPPGPTPPSPPAGVAPPWSEDEEATAPAEAPEPYESTPFARSPRGLVRSSA